MDTLYLDLGVGCDVHVIVRLMCWFIVRCGCHQLVTVWIQVQVPGLVLGFCVREVYGKDTVMDRDRVWL